MSLKKIVVNLLSLAFNASEKSVWKNLEEGKEKSRRRAANPRLLRASIRLYVLDHGGSMGKGEIFDNQC